MVNEQQTKQEQVSYNAETVERLAKERQARRAVAKRLGSNEEERR